MKNFIYQLGNYISKIYLLVIPLKLLRKPLQVFLNFSNFIISKREEKKQIDTLLKKLNLSNRVESGIFKGMIYSSNKAFGSAFIPKIIGTYEIELKPFFEDIFHLDFDLIIDIGCAEGYYANGLALKFPNTKVYAFDSNKTARNLCLHNKTINSLSNVEINSFCDFNFLYENCKNRKSLIVCDIEGSEYDLFNVNKEFDCFKFSYLIIEVHDGVNHKIVELLYKKFSKSHKIEEIYSTDDIFRPEKYSLDIDNNLNIKEKIFMYSENRLHIMRWLIMKPIEKTK